MTYRIRGWSKHFENNRTRELKELRFVILPNKHDGDGYTELLDHPNGAAHFGAWCSLVEVASKCEVRGTLSREGARPHDPASLSRLTRIPAKIFEEVLPRLVTIGWLEGPETETAIPPVQVLPAQDDSDKPQEVVTKPQEGAALARARDNRTEQKGIEQERREGEGEQARTAKPRSPGKPKLCDEEYLTELQKDEAYQRLNVRQVYTKMVRWCADRNKIPTRRRLLGWLNNEDLPMGTNGTNPQNAGNRSAPGGSQDLKFKSVIG